MNSFFQAPRREGDNSRAESPSQVLLVCSLSTVGACAVVALAYWLGSTWLAEKAFGLPAGVWVVILLAGWVCKSQARHAAGGSRSANMSAGPTGWHRWVWTGRCAAANAVDWSVGAIARIDDVLGRTAMGGLGLKPGWRRKLARFAARPVFGSGPLRIGFAMARRRAEQFIDHDQPGAAWFMIDRHADPEESAIRYALDVVVAEPAPGVLRIQTLERDGMDASWFDWTRRRPLSYESVFPLRVDPSRMHLDLSNDGELAASAPVTAELIRCAAVLARHPQRLDVQDVVLGRQLSGSTRGRASESSGLWFDESSEAMVRLAAIIEQRSVTARATEADRAGARAVSAWLASWDDSVSDEQRRRWIEACARILPDEPEVMLRLGAVRLSAMDDEMGIAALRDADAALQREHDLCVSDPVAFLQAELEHGPENPMTVARVAAGLCLTLAGVPTERLAFLQEDLLDDMRFATWLVGRDQDRALLMRVMRELREARERREALARGENGLRAA
ncbi:MAG: hypothetical protein L6Q35_03430 [Phycisphaerales bacterium]|nr:hypothetical protein [Phycisphaerales bacterium]